MIKKLPTILLLSACLLTSVALSAQSFSEWQDPQVNQVNRMEMHSHFFAYESEKAASVACPEHSANYLTLNGKWKFNWVKDSDQRPSDFWQPGYNDKAWGEMPMPGIWEMNGYGDPIYVNIGYAWRSQFKNNPPCVPVTDNHVGSYRREILVPASWKGKQIIAHFGSVTSNMYLWVNGKFVGYSEDSKLAAEFDLSKYLKPGESNLIAMQVFRWCDGTYLEDQDFFRFSGIARDSYLFARPQKHVEDIVVTPDLDAQYKNGSLEVALSVSAGVNVELTLSDACGKTVASQTVNAAKKGEYKAELTVADVNKWSAELPYLYTLTATVKDGASLVECIPVKVGFRKVQIVGADLLVNGQRIIIKGADRHELDPDGGYVVSKERMLQDISIFKQFNLNGVRTCHYPDDDYWYELCDKYGLYVVAEANIESHGMGYGEKTLAKNPSYAKAHLERNSRNVKNNRNHPSVIIWSLGNEAGFGPNFEAAYKWIKETDNSRPVQYEGAVCRPDDKGVYTCYSSTDICCPMYATYDQTITYSKSSENKPFIQCEYAHAMGNSQGGFKEYLELFRTLPKIQGGFIWDFVDQSVRWKDKNGKAIYGYGGDFNMTDASDQNFCDNGLISPDRVPNPHMYEVGYWYQSIWSELKDGKLEVKNENFFRDLSAYDLEWDLKKDGVIVRKGFVGAVNAAPQSTVTVDPKYGKIDDCGEWTLNVRFVQRETEGVLSAGHVVAKQQFVLNQYKPQCSGFKNVALNNSSIDEPVVRDNDLFYLFVDGQDFSLAFTRLNGFLSHYAVDGVEMLNDGACITPNFWRAPTDNDFGAKLQEKYLAWKNPQFVLKSLTATNEEGLAVVKAEYDVPAVSASLSLTYRINNVGAVEVSQSMKAGSAKVSNLFRFGMQLPMPKSFDRVVYYGRGPIENYADRNAVTDLGIYDQSVDEQFYSYIRPQENGTKTDIRWWKMLNPAGKGLMFMSEAPFSASALHYTVESLDEGLVKQNLHSEQIEKADLTNVLIDKAQMGLGCINSWGQVPIDKYMLPYGDYDFKFVMLPVK